MNTNVTALDQERVVVPVPGPLPLPAVDIGINLNTDSDDSPAAAVDPAPSNRNSRSSSPSASHSEVAFDSLTLMAPRNFVWGAKVIRNALPLPTIPRSLDPTHVDIDDPRKLPLCWYGVPFYSDTVFAYAQRIRVAAYMKRPILHLKPGDLDIYTTWPKLVKWFEDQSGLTMHLHQVWDLPYPLLTFFSNHEIPRVTEDMWRITCDLLDDMDYPADCKLMWHLDRNLDY